MIGSRFSQVQEEQKGEGCDKNQFLSCKEQHSGATAPFLLTGMNLANLVVRNENNNALFNKLAFKNMDQNTFFNNLNNLNNSKISI